MSKTVFKTPMVEVTIRGESNLRNLNKKVMKQFTEHMAKQPEPRQLFVELKQYWKTNIYGVFNRRVSLGLPVSGQLGNAVSFKKESLKDGIYIRTKIAKCSHDAEPGLPGVARSLQNCSGGATDDYTRYLMEGTSGSSNIYLAEIKSNNGVGSIPFDRKSKSSVGRTPGVPASLWQNWVSQFKPEMEKRFMKYFEDEYRRFVHGGK